jgi:hypothetical protein
MTDLTITIRRATPDDAPALVRIFSGPRAIAGTLQIPYTSEEARRKRSAGRHIPVSRRR